MDFQDEFDLPGERPETRIVVHDGPALLSDEAVDEFGDTRKARYPEAANVRFPPLKFKGVETMMAADGTWNVVLAYEPNSEVSAIRQAVADRLGSSPLKKDEAWCHMVVASGQTKDEAGELAFIATSAKWKHRLGGAVNTIFHHIILPNGGARAMA